MKTNTKRTHRGGIAYRLLAIGILSVLGACVLNIPYASALDVFAVFRQAHNRPTLDEALGLNMDNPFSLFENNCEASNSDSTISCNETPFPNLLFDQGSKTDNTWGYDGRGIVFSGSEKLVGGDPRLAAANRGDVLTFSEKLNTKRYLDDEKTQKNSQYLIYALLSPGLTLDMESIRVKVDGRVLASESYEIIHMEFPEEEVQANGYDFDEVMAAEVFWTDENNEFIYPENAVIELSYSAKVDTDAPSSVFGRAFYIDDSSHDESGIFLDTYQANAMIDGNIIIRRVDADDAPLAGAKYTIDGVKANLEDEANNIYSYNKNGSISEFTTNNEGAIIIKGVPMAEYTVREIQAPTGHETQAPRITKSLYADIELQEYGAKSFIWDMTSITGHWVGNLTPYIQTLDDGDMVISRDNLNKAMMGRETHDVTTLSYDQETNTYRNSTGDVVVTKNENGYHIESGDEYAITPTGDFVYDSSIGKYIIDYRADYGEEYALEFGEATVSFQFMGVNYELSYNDKTGCFDGQYSGLDTTLCKEEKTNRYTLEYYEEDGDIGMFPFNYDEEDQKYELTYMRHNEVIEEVSDAELTLAQYYFISYSSAFDHYYIEYIGTNGVLDVSRETMLASLFLFRDRTEQNGAPETIPNPQTSDTLTKATCIILITTASAFVITRKLSRR